MTKLLNWLSATLAAAGLGALATDMTGIADVPDTTGMQAVYVLAIAGGLLWRTLPDEDDTPGPDVLQGEPLNWRKWLENIMAFLKPAAPAASLTALVLIATGCAGSSASSAAGLMKWGSTTCWPSDSDNCLVIQGAGAEVRVVQKPDASVSTTLWVSMLGNGASAEVSFDPAVADPLEAEGCYDTLFMEPVCTGSEE